MSNTELNKKDGDELADSTDQQLVQFYVFFGNADFVVSVSASSTKY